MLQSGIVKRAYCGTKCLFLYHERWRTINILSLFMLTGLPALASEIRNLWLLFAGLDWTLVPLWKTVVFSWSVYIYKHICTGLYIRKGLDGVRYVTSGFGTMLIAYIMNTSRLFLVSIMWCVSTGQQKTSISWCDSGHMAVLSRRSRRANTRSYADVWRVANYSPPPLLFLHLCSAQSVGKVTPRWIQNDWQLNQ